MSGLYAIPISGMKEGFHWYEFEIGDKFFNFFEASEIKEGSLKVIVKASKGSSHIDLDIKIDGAVKISCDRCLGVFLLPVHSDSRLLVHFGRTHDESDPDIVTIAPDEHELDLMQYFYEYILLTLPIQRIHPADENGNSTCDPEMIRRLSEHMISNENDNGSHREDLKKIMNN